MPSYVTFLIVGLLAGWLLHVWQVHHIARCSERPALDLLKTYSRQRAV